MSPIEKNFMTWQITVHLKDGEVILSYISKNDRARRNLNNGVI